jgi:hypothetical protein
MVGFVAKEAITSHEKVHDGSVKIVSVTNRFWSNKSKNYCKQSHIVWLGTSCSFPFDDHKPEFP